MKKKGHALLHLCVFFCVWLADMIAVGGAGPSVNPDTEKHSFLNYSVSNAVAFAVLSNSFGVASSIIDERCLYYCVFERIFPSGAGTNRFLRFGMGDEAVRSLVNQVFDVFDSEDCEEVLETMEFELKTLIGRTDSAWMYTRKTREEMIASLSSKQMRTWFALVSDRKALFYKLMNEKIRAKEKDDENIMGRKGDK
ncbi:MAG: hypothetical protein EOM51_11420 [Clostridia bacterium]|jgi:hypothetical protein|nr:hypothetical protein [Clostridia bacterium]